MSTAEKSARQASPEVESREPTLVSRNGSINDEKPAARPASGSDSESQADANEASRAKAEEAGDKETTEAAEKQTDLTRRATATSHAGESITNTRTREDGTEYPTGAKLTLITVALCLAVFLMALDNSIIATAIPKITDEFHSLPDVGWYGSG